MIDFLLPVQHNNIQRLSAVGLADFLPGNLVAVSVRFSYIVSHVLLSPVFPQTQQKIYTTA
jgi:hypothetical protein